MPSTGRGELAAAVEVRRHFPGIFSTAQARECARIIAGWNRCPCGLESRHRLPGAYAVPRAASGPWLNRHRVATRASHMNGPGTPSLQRYPARRTRTRRRPRERPLRHQHTTPHGWCCGFCHPPDHLRPDQVRWEPATEPARALL